MPERLADFPLQVAHTGLPRVVLDDLVQRGIGDLDLLGLEAVRVQLPAHEIAPSDLQLFLGRVAGEADDLHAIAQRTGDGVEHVGRRNEDDPAEIERDAQIIIAKCIVLLRVEYLQQGGGRIAVDARAELVDFVQHEHTGARPGLADRLDDITRHRADIGPAMATDLCLVMDAAQADALEFAPHRPRDRLAERRLSDPRRADEAQDRRFALRGELAHGEIFDDAPLHLLEAVVVLIENLSRLLDVDRGFL